MEIIYPDNFIRFFNDTEEIDEVGEFEILNYNFYEAQMIFSHFNGYRFTYPSQGPNYNLSDSQNISLDDFRSPLPPPGVPGSGGPPGAPPPGYIPAKTDQGVQHLVAPSTSSGPQVKAVSPESIQFCLYRYTYLWQSNGKSYWAYLINVDKKTVSGFRWMGWSWSYFGVDIKKIDSFVCY